jgi:hypothetical protein
MGEQFDHGLTTTLNRPFRWQLQGLVRLAYHSLRSSELAGGMNYQEIKDVFSRHLINDKKEAAN